MRIHIHRRSCFVPLHTPHNWQMIIILKKMVLSIRRQSYLFLLHTPYNWHGIVLLKKMRIHIRRRSCFVLLHTPHNWQGIIILKKMRVRIRRHSCIVLLHTHHNWQMIYIFEENACTYSSSLVLFSFALLLYSIQYEILIIKNDCNISVLDNYSSPNAPAYLP